jgi:arylsulfatase A-like enzyme
VSFDGEPRAQLHADAESRPNVLLVVIESVSGAHVDRLAEAHDRPRLALMPELDAIAGESLSFATFFAHQRKTNRGLYALLCGELPNLRTGLPKMSSHPEGGRTCLPEILARAGYETQYLQAAPLAFMLKDRFMPRIGFERVDGGDFFERAYARSAWGVDDRAFFEGAARQVEVLRERRPTAGNGAPWFLTLLTVGTHHPFVVPPDFRPEGVQTEVERTLRYADIAVGAFDRRLRELGVFEDTLVIYTSDESLGPTRTATRIDRLVGQSWGFLIARTPAKEHDLITEPFAQIDVAASILDYVGLQDRANHLFGRSIFRHYALGRHVFFANSNAYFNGMLDPYGQLALCMLDFESCRMFRPAGARVFGPRRADVAWDPEAGRMLREMAERSLNPDDGTQRIREFQLLTDPVFVAERRVFEIVHGGQYLALAPGDWVEVDLVARVEDAAGEAEVRHRVESREQGLLYEDTISIAAGEILRLRYRFGAAEAVHGFGSRSYARSPSGKPIRLVFDTASLALHSVEAGESPIEPGFELEVLEPGPAGLRKR